jgi:hypothetical protein
LKSEAGHLLKLSVVLGGLVETTRQFLEYAPEGNNENEEAEHEG